MTILLSSKGQIDVCLHNNDIRNQAQRRTLEGHNLKVRVPVLE